MNKYGYGAEKLGKVMRILVGDGSLRERINKSFIHFSAITSPLGEPHLPPDAQKEYDEIHQTLTRISGPEGSAPTTINQMSDDELRECAQKLFDLYWKVERAYTLENQ